MANLAWIPEGSEIQEQDDILIVTPPSDWMYVGYGLEGEFVSELAGEIKISCTCHTTGKCNPFRASGPMGSTSGCAGSCANCTMKTSLIRDDFEFRTGGYINPSIESYFLNADEQLPAAFEAMYESEEVNAAITTFLENIYQGNPIPSYIEGEDYVEAPEGYKIAFANICGRATPLLVPEDVITESSAAGEKASCSCTRGTCTLKKKSIVIGSATWCEGSCTGTCTLTISTSLVQFSEDSFDF